MTKISQPISLNHTLTALLAAVVLCCMWACSHPQQGISQRLEAAQTSIEDANYGDAQRQLDQLYELFVGKDTHPSVEQLGRMALLYMRLSDCHNTEDNISAALDCYIEAIGVDSMAAIKMFSTVGVEDIAHAELLNSLNNGIMIPADSLIGEDIDSLEAPVDEHKKLKKKK